MDYVYKFVNADGQTIYVGITMNLNKRLRSQHFTSNGHLPIACYEETATVFYSTCASIDDAKIRERYLINILAPKFNVRMNNKSEFSFKLEDFDWKSIEISKPCVQSGTVVRYKYGAVSSNKILDFKYRNAARIVAAIDAALLVLSRGCVFGNRIFTKIGIEDTTPTMPSLWEGYELCGIELPGYGLYENGRFQMGRNERANLHVVNNLASISQELGSSVFYAYPMKAVSQFQRDCMTVKDEVLRYIGATCSCTGA